MATVITGTTHDWIDRIIAGRYALRDVLGEGGMGTVFRAHQLGVGRDVAVKILRPSMAANDHHVTELFYREARAASRLSHPNIVTVYDFGRTEDGLLFIAMELLRGRSLTDHLYHDALTLPEQLHIGIQLCSALGEAHAEGVVHRDVKPDNVLIVPRRWEPRLVKVLDFGLAKVVGSAFETGQTGMRFGTPLYMSPEQILGRPLDHRADIYALGVLLYEMLAGRPPFSGRTPVHICMQHIEADVPRLCAWDSNLSLPPELDELIARMMAKEPDERPADIDDVRASLESVLEWERATGPTTQTRVPWAPGTATTELPSVLRQSQPFAVLPSMRSTDAFPTEYEGTRAVPLSVPPGIGLAATADPQGTITQLIPELARLSRRTGSPSTNEATPSPHPPSPPSMQAAHATLRTRDTAPVERAKAPSRRRTQPVRHQKPHQERKTAAGGAAAPTLTGPLRFRRSAAGLLRRLPWRRQTLELEPRTPNMRAQGRRVAKHMTTADRAEYAARAILAALAGAAAGWGVYWLIVLQST